MWMRRDYSESERLNTMAVYTVHALLRFDGSSVLLDIEAPSLEDAMLLVESSSKWYLDPDRPYASMCEV